MGMREERQIKRSLFVFKQWAIIVVNVPIAARNPAEKSIVAGDIPWRGTRPY